MSGEIFHIEAGEDVCIPTGVISGTTPVAGKFPRLTLRDKGGAVVAGPTGFTDVGNGHYWANFGPLPVGAYSGFVEVYDDAAYTQPTNGIVWQFTCVMVRDSAAALLNKLYCDYVADGTVGQAIAGAASYAGVNSIVDQTSHNANNNMTLARRRLFPNRAAVQAATMDSADNADGECLRIKMDTVDFDTGSPNVTAQTIKHLRWTGE